VGGEPFACGDGTAGANGAAAWSVHDGQHDRGLRREAVADGRPKVCEEAALRAQRTAYTLRIVVFQGGSAQWLWVPVMALGAPGLPMERSGGKRVSRGTISPGRWREFRESCRISGETSEILFEVPAAFAVG
jgi:hypothetical protein